jgi:ABC-type multidrug transport system ATPase subunit
MPLRLELDGLGKRFGERWVLRDVSLVAGPGLLGLVGPNGAGKTTLMRILATLVEPTSGTARWNGLDTRRDGRTVRHALGYLPQEFGVYPQLTARQFLGYLAALKGVPRGSAARRVDEVLEQVHLTAEADQRLGTYSGGMKQRVGIAQAILNDPELLIVDEPTGGLDPAERVHFRRLLASLKVDRLVLLSTHIISDVEAVADRLVLLSGGYLVTDAQPQELIASARGLVWTVVTGTTEVLRLQQAYPVSALAAQSGATTVRVLSSERPCDAAMPAEPTLEDAYLVAIGNGGHGNQALT